MVMVATHSTQKNATAYTWNLRHWHHRFNTTSKQSHIPKYADTNTQPTLTRLILSHSQEASIFWSVNVYAHTCMLVAHCNPHVVSPSCQGPICLHYHHTARGSRSVRAHGKSNAPLSGYKKQIHYLDVCHVTSPQDQEHYKGKKSLNKTAFPERRIYRAVKWGMCLWSAFLSVFCLMRNLCDIMQNTFSNLPLSFCLGNKYGRSIQFVSKLNMEKLFYSQSF